MKTILVGILLELVSVGGVVLSEEIGFPSRTWLRRKPIELDMDDAKLDLFAATVGGDGVIIKNGYLVKSWGNASSKKDWASAAKPVLSTLLLLAVQERKLASVDALVKDVGWQLEEKDTTMTYRHLANMVSGYACQEAPGSAWAYNDYGIELYARSLERVFDQKLDVAIRERLATLQFQDGSIFGSRNELGVVASPRDFARIGWLWLNHGNWNGQQIIDAKSFQEHIQPGVPASTPRTKDKGRDYLGIGTYGGGTDQTPHGPGGYGFNFWFNERAGDNGQRTWPSLPSDTYQANGMWNRDTVTVIPSLQMVVAVRGAKLGTFEPGKVDSDANQNLKLLVESSERPTPPPRK
ncbi:MAG: serine hydrolase domain-containing protein [Pirellulaceae bacterium]|nr:serine hydrolase domain-containing protein [Pirellulaceae bacterium]